MAKRPLDDEELSEAELLELVARREAARQVPPPGGAALVVPPPGGAALVVPPPGGAAPGDAKDEEAGAGTTEPTEPDDFGRLVLRLTPSEQFDQSLKDAVQAIDELAQECFPGAVLAAFGSAVQGVHLEGSDLDLCMDVPDLDDQVADAAGKSDNTAHVDALKKLISTLPSSLRVVETRFFRHMKVPIVTLGFKSSLDTQVDADVSIGTVFEGVEKGFTDRLVRRVLARFPRALHMVRVVKLWAKAEKLNKAYEGFLNALGWTLLVIFFFMERGEIMSGLLDCEEPNERGVGIGGLPPPLDNGMGEPPGLEEVPPVEEVAEFFEWVQSMWKEWPKEGTWGISLVDGTKVEVPEPEKRWADTCNLFIEDPGIRTAKDAQENVARSVKSGLWEQSVRQCGAAAQMLRSEDPEAASRWVRSLRQRVELDRSRAQRTQKLGGPVMVPPVLTRPGAGPQVVPARILPPAARPGLELMPPWERPPPLAARGGQPWKKSKTVCRWFKLGECWSGENCSNIHELDDAAVP